MINYYLITKPGIVLGNLITFAAGFFLAAPSPFSWSLFLATLLGLAFIMASACVFNNYIDRPLDQKMERTKNRPLVTGLISGSRALVFATCLGLVGGGILFWGANLAALLVASAGFFVYVFLYSLWKGRTIYGTAIGSIAGAIPPVVGYIAVAEHFDLGALLLFTMLILWQMPHFFSIAVYRLADYTAASIPVLPVKKGLLRTKIHMSLYIMAFTLVASLLTLFGYTGYLYLLTTSLLGLAWLLLSLQGFRAANDTQWGQQMFRLSLLLITLLCLVLPFDIQY